MGRPTVPPSYSTSAPSDATLPFTLRVLHCGGTLGAVRNAGVAASTGDVVAFVDSDCVPEPQWLDRGLTAFQRRTGRHRAGSNAARPVLAPRALGRHARVDVVHRPLRSVQPLLPARAAVGGGRVRRRHRVFRRGLDGGMGGAPPRLRGTLRARRRGASHRHVSGGAVALAPRAALWQLEHARAPLSRDARHVVAPGVLAAPRAPARSPAMVGVTALGIAVVTRSPPSSLSRSRCWHRSRGGTGRTPCSPSRSSTRSRPPASTSQSSSAYCGVRSGSARLSSSSDPISSTRRWRILVIGNSVATMVHDRCLAPRRALSRTARGHAASQGARRRGAQRRTRVRPDRRRHLPLPRVGTGVEPRRPHRELRHGREPAPVHPARLYNHFHDVGRRAEPSGAGVPTQSGALVVDPAAQGAAPRHGAHGHAGVAHQPPQVRRHCSSR